MKSIFRKMLSLHRDEEGAETVEWVIVVAVLVVAIVGGLSFLGKTANNALGTIGNQITGATSGGTGNTPPPTQ